MKNVDIISPSNPLFIRLYNIFEGSFGSNKSAYFNKISWEVMQGSFERELRGFIS